MMETEEAEQFITFSLAGVHDGIQADVISHEEICEPVDEECVLEEVTIEDDHHDLEDSHVVQIISESNEQGVEIEEECEGETVVYPHAIFIKKEAHQNFSSGDDESMAVEALRQLGGMYPCYEDSKKEVQCVQCEKSFPQSEMVKHKETCHKPQKNSCRTCGEKFERKIDLNNHMVCHQVDRPHACRTCGNLFRSKANLQAHMVEVHRQEKPHKCTVCGADFQRPSSLSNHMKIHNYVAGRALVQGSNANSASVKVINIEQAPSAVQSTQNTDQIQWAVQTIQTEHGEEITIDQDKLDTLQEFTVLPNGEIAQIEYTTENSSNLSNEDGVTDSDKSYTCSQCGVSFARSISLTLHEKTHVAKIDWPSPVECGYCDKQFQDSNHLMNHQVSCSKKCNNENGGTSNSKWGKHACAECGKKFTTKQKMFRHQWIHRKKTHSCEVCGTQFEKQSELDIHRLADHPADTPFTCHECGKSFVSRQGLWEHGRTHAGSPAHFHCDKCSKTFSSRQGYLIHHRTHTGERPYGCKFCWKAFRDGGTLRKHERIHTGERPHVCPLCSRAFNQKVVLREHVRWVHAAGKNETETTEPPFPCPLCGVMNQDRDELCAHIVKHSDQMIAQAKAKTVNSSAAQKVKPQKKRGKKTIEPEKISEEQDSNMDNIDITEEQDPLLSIEEPMEVEAETEETYIIVKNDDLNTVCIKTVGKKNSVMKTDGGGTGIINLISVTKSNSKNVEKSKNINPVQVIPLSSAPGEIIQIISSSNKPNNTLRLITKQNENLPVLAIKNPQTVDIKSKSIKSDYSEKDVGANGENETVVLKSVNLKTEVTESEETVNESEEISCGICGDEFNDKNVLMEHVKMHI